MNQLVFASLCLLIFAVCITCQLMSPYICPAASTGAHLRPHFLIIILVYALIAAIPLLFYWRANQCQPTASANDLAQFVGREVMFNAEICQDELVHGHLVVKPQMLLFPRKVPLSGKSVLMFPTPPEINQNTGSVQVSAFVRSPESPSSAWEFDQKRYLAQQDIYCLCFRAHLSTGAANVVAITPSAQDGLLTLWKSFYSVMKLARERMVTIHRLHLGQEYGDLLSSIVLGNKAVSLPSATTKRYRDVGLSHLLAASGFNLTIVTVMSIAVCSLFTRSMLVANTLCVGSILAFVVLAGPSPSVVRAALMSFTVLLARNSKRRVRVVSVLALAFLITDLLDPICVSDLGFQLSYASTIGILCGATALSNLFYAGKHRLLKNLVSSLALVLIAQASVLPIQLLNFWKTGTLFIPANLIAEPLITPITILGFASSVISLFQCDNSILNLVLDWLTKAIDYLAFIALKVLADTVQFLSSIQGCTLSVGPPMSWSIAIYYLCLCLSYLSLNKGRYRLLAFLSLAVALACLLFNRPAAAQLTIAVLHKNLIVVDRQHHALVMSIDPEHAPTAMLAVKSNATDDPSVEKYLAYHAAKIDPSYFNLSQLDHDLFTIRTFSSFNLIIAGAACTAAGPGHRAGPGSMATGNVLLLLDEKHPRSVNSGRDDFPSGILQEYKPEIVVLLEDGKRFSVKFRTLPHDYAQSNSCDVQIEHSSDVRLRTFVDVASQQFDVNCAHRVIERSAPGDH